MKIIWFVIVSSIVAAANAQETTADPSQKAAASAGGALLRGGAGGLQENLVNQATGLAASETSSAAKSFLDKYFAYSEVGINLGVPSKPTYNVLVVAPLSDVNDVTNTIFNQSSIYYRDGRTTVNLGLGYRRLIQDNKVLLGANTFYDQEFPYNHQRTSIGVEARTTTAELNANRYWGVSGWRDVSGGFEELALGGYDVEVGISMPYMQWAKAYGRKFEWFAVDGATNLKGTDISFRAVVPALPGLILEAGHRDYQNYAGSNFVRVSYNLLADKKAKNQPLFTETAWAMQSMEQYRFDKVRRENLIVKQRRSKFGLVFVGYKS